MKTRQAFGKSLRAVREARGVTQEDFSIVSSRTYVSALERGQKSPTLDKIEELAKVLKVHPLTLLCLTFTPAGGHRELESLFARVRSDLEGIRHSLAVGRK